MGLIGRISRQLSNPSGFGGRVIAALMNRGNAAMNARAIELLELEDTQSVLDVGFGGGLSLPELLARAGRVAGVDRAEDMVERARREHAEAVRADRLDVRVGDVHELPFPDATFDRVLTVNTVYFWPDLPAALTEVKRTLKPGGRLVIGIRDPKQMRRVSRDIFTVRPPHEVRDAAVAAGFGDVVLESSPDRPLHFIVATEG